MNPYGFWCFLRDALYRLARRAEGAAAAEFAVISPVMGVLMIGTLDLAQMANQGLALDAAIRVGASYAIANPTNTTAIQCLVGQAVTCPSGVSPYATFPGTVAVTFDAPAGYADTSAFAPPQYCTCADGTSIACSNDTAEGGALCGGNGPKHYYVRIKAVETLSSLLLPLSALTPSCPGGSGYCITRTLTVRVL